MTPLSPPFSVAPARPPLAIDAVKKRLILSYSGLIAGHDITTDIFANARQLDTPWLYDIILDFSDYKGTVLTSDMENLAARWNAVAQGRDRGRLSALISTDSLFRVRMPLRIAAFPARITRLFGTLDEAITWMDTSNGLSPKSLAS